MRADSGHHVQLEKPDVVVAAVQEVMDRISRHYLAKNLRFLSQMRRRRAAGEVYECPLRACGPRNHTKTLCLADDLTNLSVSARGRDPRPQNRICRTRFRSIRDPEIAGTAIRDCPILSVNLPGEPAPQVAEALMVPPG